MIKFLKNNRWVSQRFLSKQNEGNFEALDQFKKLTVDELQSITGGGCPEVISYYRQHFSLTQEDLADGLSVDVRTIRNWERGYTTPRGDDLYNLSQIFNISMNEVWDAENKYH